MGKYFGTDGFRGEANKALTAQKAFQVGRYIGWYYGQKHDDRQLQHAHGANRCKHDERQRDGGQHVLHLFQIAIAQQPAVGRCVHNGA